MFYYERKDESTGAGPYLKFGKKGKPVTTVLDLGQEGVEVLRVTGSQRKFRINAGTAQHTMKCESKQDMEEWISILGTSDSHFN
jgi:hypothetical protein